MIKAIVFVIMLPLALCIGVYACTAAHFAVLTH